MTPLRRTELHARIAPVTLPSGDVADDVLQDRYGCWYGLVMGDYVDLWLDANDQPVAAGIAWRTRLIAVLSIVTE